jgi:hypothetical protein
MSREVKAQQVTKELLPPGSYQATLYSIVDLGDQYSEKYWKYNRKIRLSFEIPSEMREFSPGKGEQPMTIHKEYTLSFGEKSSLYKDLLSWTESGFAKYLEAQSKEDSQEASFDLESLLGKNCLLAITIQKGTKSQYNAINGISWLMKGMKKADLINDPVIYQISDGRNDVFESFPDFLKEKILKWQEAKGEDAE